jgi:hypothetical protein
MSDQGNQAARELLHRLLMTAHHIENLVQTIQLTVPRTVRNEFKGIRQRLSRDIEAIDGYLKSIPRSEDE